MNRKFLKFNLATLALSAMFVLGSCSKENVEPVVSEAEETTVDKKAVVGYGSGWQLVWSDEFNGNSLNTSNWKIGYPWGSKTHNHQGYAKAENAVVNNGILHLYAGGGKEGNKYNTGVVSCLKKIDFSDPNVEWIVEARLKLGNKAGIWPAFWLNSTGGWPNVNEIDIMEQKGWGSQNVFETVMHFGVSSGKRPSQHITKNGGNNLDNNWHTYSVAIKKNEVKIMFDRQTVNRVTGSKKDKLRTKTFNIILNSAIGGDWGGKGYKKWIDDFSQMSVYQVDYVAIFKR